MKTYSLQRKQLIKRPLDEVFEFFSRPENLTVITPTSLGFDMLTPLPLDMQVGTLIDYTVKPMMFPLRWRTLITEYDPPHKFIDQQLKGPYSFWHHTHTFEHTPEGTLITDDLVYAIPFGIIGRLAHALFVKNKLKMIFDYRVKAISGYFESK